MIILLFFKIFVDGLNYLFTGDIGIQTENDLVNMYGRLLKSDVLKVPHHGSNTSSSVDFLYHVDPSIAVSVSNVYFIEQRNYSNILGLWTLFTSN